MAPLKKKKCVFCSKKQLIVFECASCNQCFCMNHRMPEDHACPCNYQNKDQLKKDLGSEVIPVKVDKI